MRLIATDDDNRRNSSELTVTVDPETEKRLRTVLEYGDTDNLLDLLDEIYDREDSVEKSGEIRMFMDDVEKMGMACVEEGRDEG